MPFMRTTDRVWNANHLGQLGEVTGDDVAGWLKVGTSVLSASAPLIQTFVPDKAQAQYQAFVDKLNKNVNPAAPGLPPQPPPPSVPSGVPRAPEGFVLPTWAPWVLLAAVGAYAVSRSMGSRRRNPVYGDPSTKYSGFAQNPRRRRHRRRKNPLTRGETALALRIARGDGLYSKRKHLTSGEKQWYRGRSDGEFHLAGIFGAYPRKGTLGGMRHRRALPRAARGGRMHYSLGRKS